MKRFAACPHQSARETAMSAEIREIKGCGNPPTTHSIIRAHRQSGDVSSFFLWRGDVDFFLFDAEYVRRLLAADPVVEEHFASYFSKLLTIKLRARKARRPEIDEVIQETLCRALNILRTPPGIRSPERLGPFVNSICNNVWHEHCRPKRVEQFPEIFEEPASGDPSAESNLISSELKAAVHAVLDQLSEKDRLLLHAIFIEERSKDEVCAEMNVDRDYLRVLLHRAKKVFKRLFLKKTDDDRNNDEDSDEPR